jgi:hypothetical protein
MSAARSLVGEKALFIMSKINLIHYLYLAFSALEAVRGCREPNLISYVVRISIVWDCKAK